MHIYYRMHDNQVVCEGVELFPPAAPTYDGVDMFAMPFRDVREWLARRDPSCVGALDSLTSRTLGIALYAPVAEEEPERPIASVYVFPPGGYDRFLPPVVA